MARVLFLHIGTHKTGTSSLQRYLSSWAADLLTENILYPKSGRPETVPDGHHLLAWSVSEAIQKKRGFVDDHCWTEVLDEICAHDPALVVLSAEGFDGLTKEEIAQVREYTSGFTVKIVVYLRNHLGFMVSAYKQQVKGGRTGMPFGEFMERNIERCNYPGLLDKWADCFGRENVIIRLYDKEKNDPGIKKDFLQILGLAPEEIEQFGRYASSDVNVSPQDDVIKIIRFLNVLEQKVKWGNQTDFFHKLRRSLIRKNGVGKTVMTLVMTLSKPFLKGSLYTAEDMVWLKGKTAKWDEAFFDTYLDPNDRSYFEF